MSVADTNVVWSPFYAADVATWPIQINSRTETNKRAFVIYECDFRYNRPFFNHYLSSFWILSTKYCTYINVSTLIIFRFKHRALLVFDLAIDQGVSELIKSELTESCTSPTMQLDTYTHMWVVVFAVRRKRFVKRSLQALF